MRRLLASRARLFVVWLTLPVSTGALVGACGGGCGGAAPTTETGGEGPREGAEVRADAIPLPSMPDAPAEDASAARTPPTLNTVEEANQALTEGFYGAVAERLDALSGPPAARALLAARLALATGRYDDAVSQAREAARDTGLREQAVMLEAEAHFARGRLDDVDRLLGALPATHDRASLYLARAAERRGRTVEAGTFYRRIIQGYNSDRITSRDAEGLAYVGSAAHALGSPRDANTAFQESVTADRQRVETQLEWARLFLDKYDAGHAEECVRDALRVNPEHPVAHALYARIRMVQNYNFVEAERHLERALAVNPNLAMARVTRAGLSLYDLDVAATDRELAAVVAQDPSDLEALSVRAAGRLLADDTAGFEAAKREVLRRHPTYSQLFTIIAEYAEWEHRYPAIVAMSREAIALNPRDAVAQATLGINLLRMGDEETGLTALREAWRRDRYNVQVFNILNLYDDVIPQQYGSFEQAPFRFRMHQEERPVLERYVPRHLSAAYADMVRRYGFTPDGPLAMELYADVQHFSLRTTGLPNLGVQGVCFGKVVTAISPRGGPFNWGQITWHELAHVFHIQLSHNHVPRWFTEGLAEYETIVARPEWRREMDHDLHAAIVADRLPAIVDMNRAFTHARTGQDMMVAYYASSQMVVFIAERFGFARIPRMLRAWGEGKTTAEVIQQVLGVSAAELDTQFRAHTRTRLAALDGQFNVDMSAYTDLEALQQASAAAPNDAGALARLAAARLIHGDSQQATADLARALTLDPNEPVALYLTARLALAQERLPEARAALEKIVTSGRDGFDLRLLLGRAALAAEDVAGARAHLEAATRLQPWRSTAWLGLFEIGTQSEDADLRRRALARLVDLEEHDRELHAQALDLAIDERRFEDAVRFGERSLMVDPARVEAHLALAGALGERAQHEGALYEYDTALLLSPAAPAHVQLARARHLMALGRRADAQAAVDEAMRLDPTTAEDAAAILAGPGQGGAAAQR
ncbi:MAG: tetratricopeptide repeat protein [Sandaracinaceae bacterium]|nr:tetratricopeptide repeat protein [Sandaracinaceae bacterium]